MRFMVFVRSPMPLAALHKDALVRAGVLLDVGDFVPAAFGAPVTPEPPPTSGRRRSVLP